MSNHLFHASVGFVTGGLILLAWGEMGPTAFLSAILALLIDLDSLASPDREHENLLHSSYLPLALVPLCLLSVLLPAFGPYPALALVACSSHLLLDVLQGEPLHRTDPLFRHLPLQAWERPKVARALELLSLPAALALMLV